MIKSLSLSEIAVFNFVDRRLINVTDWKSHNQIIRWQDGEDEPSPLPLRVLKRTPHLKQFFWWSFLIPGKRLLCSRCKTSAPCPDLFFFFPLRKFDHCHHMADIIVWVWPPAGHRPSPPSALQSPTCSNRLLVAGHFSLRWILQGRCCSPGGWMQGHSERVLQGGGQEISQGEIT